MSIFFLFILDQTGCKKEPIIVSDPLRVSNAYTDAVGFGAANTLTYGNNRYWLGQANAHFVYDLGCMALLSTKLVLANFCLFIIVIRKYKIIRKIKKRSIQNKYFIIVFLT